MLIQKAEERIAQYLRFLEGKRHPLVLQPSLEVFATTDRLRTPPQNVSWTMIETPYWYGAEWTSYWFRLAFEVPPSAADTELFLKATPNADSLVFLDGVPIGAINPFHGKVRITNSATVGTRYAIHMESYAGHKYPGMHPLDDEAVILTLDSYLEDYPNRLREVLIVSKERAIDRLYYDAGVLYQLAKRLDDDSLRRHRIIAELYRGLRSIRFTADRAELYDQIRRASAVVTPLLETAGGETRPTVYAIGHAHIDHAWLWPIWETERKAARTFANMAHLAEEFPEFVFLQSQPAQMEIVEREYPAIFEAVKRAYEHGQWEPNGGMWVEADCNVSGGESLIRQFLVGKRSTRRMFDYEGDTLWLPDVFGYSAALPQILAGCEIGYFVTSKINWNDTTRFPYDTFLWRGIDGSGVKTHFITSREGGYNGHVRVEDAFRAWSHLQHKELQRAVIKPIGEGDGGGGTMRADLEAARRLEDLEGAPRVRWAQLSSALAAVFENDADLPEWWGELYLELHRGTYTTQARTKRYNRKLEFALREVEALFSMIAILSPKKGSRYPRKRVLEAWKKILTNQFHDIIPGSSIRAVYEDAERWYREVEAEAGRLVAVAGEMLTRLLSPQDGEISRLLAFNTLSWPRRERISIPAVAGVPLPTGIRADGATTPVQQTTTLDGEAIVVGEVRVPAFGCTTVTTSDEEEHADSPFTLVDDRLTTPFYEVAFDGAGRITSLVERTTRRRLVRPGLAFNALQSAEDLPIKWDAWDIDSDWEDTLQEEKRLESSVVVSDGPLFIQIRRRYVVGKRSTLVQDVVFSASSPRIDFVTRVDWHEEHRLLKVAFPVNLTTDRVRCEIQYGHLFRNTHDNTPADRAQFEVVAHKWIAVEDPAGGVALLNDCKYGHDIHGATMRLTLLRSPKAPDPEADMGEHEFTYSILPFVGPFSVQAVVREAYALNVPCTVFSGRALGSAEEASPSTFPIDPADAGLAILAVDNENVIIESVKPAELREGESIDGDAEVVVRLYEAAGGPARAMLTCAVEIAAAHETNMLERNAVALEHRGGEIPLVFRPFEIKTVVLSIQDGLFR